jgi:hypothetical protein
VHGLLRGRRFAFFPGNGGWVQAQEVRVKDRAGVGGRFNFVPVRAGDGLVSPTLALVATPGARKPSTPLPAQAATLAHVGENNAVFPDV